MSHLSVDQLRESLGTVPKVQEVRDQTSGFYPSHWSSRWPEHLRARMPKILREVPPNGAKQSISRKDVFGYRPSGDWTIDTALEFYVAACAWGTGNKAQSVHRVVTPLSRPDAADRLLAGLQSAQTGSPETTYYGFNNMEGHKLWGLGPAFFTKLMYFAAGEPTAATRRHPLILDARVAKSLGWKRRTGWRTTAGTQSYAAYLDVVEEVRSEGPWSDVPADVLEYRLFQMGSNR